MLLISVTVETKSKRKYEKSVQKFYGNNSTRRMKTIGNTVRDRNIDIMNQVSTI